MKWLLGSKTGMWGPNQASSSAIGTPINREGQDNWNWHQNEEDEWNKRILINISFRENLRIFHLKWNSHWILHLRIWESFHHSHVFWVYLLVSLSQPSQHIRIYIEFLLSSFFPFFFRHSLFFFASTIFHLENSSYKQFSFSCKLLLLLLVVLVLCIPSFRWWWYTMVDTYTHREWDIYVAYIVVSKNGV